jgi:hypothetical protein
MLPVLYCLLVLFTFFVLTFYFRFLLHGSPFISLSSIAASNFFFGGESTGVSDWLVSLR